MPRLRALVAKVRALFGRRAADRDLAAELESHLAMHAEDNVRRGMTPDEGRRQALLKLGGLAQVEERYRAARSIPSIERLVRDVRLAARTLRKTPAFSAVAVLTLGLGMGANAAVFSVVNATLFRPLPIDRPDELVAINAVRAGVPTFSYPDYRDLRDRNSVLSGIAAYRLSPMNIEAGGPAARIWGNLVTGNYFDLLGVRAAVGRALGASDDIVPGGHPVLVLSDDYWRRQFSADPQIAGRVVRINGAAFTIVGVMPAGFRGTERLFTPALWVPMMMQSHIESGNDWLERRGTNNIFLIGRLPRAAAAPEALASLNAIASEIGRSQPLTPRDLRIAFSSAGLLGTMLRGPVIAFSGAIAAAAGLVLLLACANLAGLLLTRAADLRRDTSIRLALGAQRADLIRRSLAESGLIALAGTAVALILAQWTATALTNWRLPTDLPLEARIAVDARVVAYALALGIVSTVFVGLVPVWQSSRTDVVSGLKEETPRWRRGWHARDLIVGTQIMLSTLLLVCAVLVAGSLKRAARLDVGFVAPGAVSARVDLGLQGYSRERARQFQRDVIAEIAALPGIESVATASALPLSLDVSTHRVYVEGRGAAPGTNPPRAIYYQISPAFFRTLQTRFVAGRDFTAQDTEHTPRVAIVNEAFAMQLVGRRDATGQRFRLGTEDRWIEIVGVVQDGKYEALGESPTPVVFHSGAQWYNPTTTVVARSSLPEGDVLGAMRRVIHQMDPALSLFDDRPLTELLVLPMLPMRVAAGLLGAFGLLAIGLVLVGTYGALSQAVAQRTPEICIRVAIGASSQNVVGLVLGHVAVVWALGVGSGVTFSLATSPLLSPLLLEVPARDPAVIAAVCGVLATVAGLAAWLPARRALAASPSSLLRRG
jgi:predicted permease